MKNTLNNSDLCNLCPRLCNISRKNDILGYCKLPYETYVTRASLHLWEEPIISGVNGSGTIFFTGCNLKCVFCQNEALNYGLNGTKLKINELADLFIRVQDNNATNINLVTPTPYSKNIIEAIKLSKLKGLKIPIVYNTSGYENKNIINELNDYIDIYLTDFKYFNNEIGKKYSKVTDYVEIAKIALAEMYKSKNKIIIEDGVMKSGIIVRVLVLPDHYEDSKKIIKYLYNTYGDNIYISILSQYTPNKKVLDSNLYPELKNRIKHKKYNEIVNYALSLNIKNCYIQDFDVATESFIPDFSISPIKLK